MIWFFLAGMVAGAVGVLKYCEYWVDKHLNKVSAEEIINEIRQAGYPDEHLPGHRPERDIPEQEGTDDRKDHLG